MKNTMIIASLLVLFMTIGFALSDDIPFGANEKQVKQFFSDEGYTFKGIDRIEGLLFVGGTEFETPSHIFANIAPDSGLKEVVITLFTEDYEAISKYRSIRLTMIGKYGKPTDDFELFTYPYKAGDGYEEQAISEKKCYLDCFWTNSITGEKYSSAILSTNTDLTVQIIYAK